jgi:hypothetical protein
MSVVTVVIVGFNVGGAWQGVERCDWFGRWVNGGSGGRFTLCGSGGLHCWDGRRHIRCWSVLGFVVSLSGRNQKGHWYGSARAKDSWHYCWVWQLHGCKTRCTYISSCGRFSMSRHLVTDCVHDIVGKAVWEHGWWGHRVPRRLMVKMVCSCMTFIDGQTGLCKCGPTK